MCGFNINDNHKKCNDDKNSTNRNNDKKNDNNLNDNDNKGWTKDDNIWWTGTWSEWHSIEKLWSFSSVVPQAPTMPAGQEAS